LAIPFLVLIDDTTKANDATSSTDKNALHVVVVRRDIEKFIIIFFFNRNIVVYRTGTVRPL